MWTTTAIEESEIDGLPGLCMNRCTRHLRQQDNKYNNQNLAGTDHGTGVFKSRRLNVRSVT
jgi:hypothetical protein